MKFTHIKTITAVLLICLMAVPFAAAQDATSETVHIIQPGENLFRIALSYGLTTDDLAAANGITDPTRILAGQTLTIPDTEAASEPQERITEQTVIEESASEEPAVEVVIVPNGDEGQAAESVLEEVETVAEPAEAVVEAEPEIETRPVYYTIRRGDTLRAIAQQHGTTEEDLMAINNMVNANRILAGQQLLIRNEPIPAVEESVEAAMPETTVVEDPFAPASEAEIAEAEAVTHIVQSGEYLSAIARRYGVSNDLIIAANNITTPDQVYAGQELIIPTTLSAAEAEAIIYAEPGAAIGTGKEIVVDLGNSKVYAYQDGILLYEAVSSNGLPATPTVQGNFTVQSKVRSQTMSGPGYWLPNVEWVMYFYQGYALHGAYWHDNWGQPMSHGCVNLKNEDAKWFYEFADYGTPVTVQL